MGIRDRSTYVAINPRLVLSNEMTDSAISTAFVNSCHLDKTIAAAILYGAYSERWLR